MTPDRLRYQVAGGADWIAARPFGHCPWRCEPCQWISLEIEAAALGLDMARAEAIAGRRCDGATQARRESIAWG